MAKRKTTPEGERREGEKGKRKRFGRIICVSDLRQKSQSHKKVHKFS